MVDRWIRSRSQRQFTLPAMLLYETSEGSCEVALSRRRCTGYGTSALEVPYGASSTRLAKPLELRLDGAGVAHTGNF